MSISTLVIGLGGTGVLTIRALKTLYQRLPKDEQVPASFLAFDFDRSALLAGDHKDRFGALDEDEFFYLNPKGIQEILRNLDRGENGGLAWEKILRWFPDRANVQIPVGEVEANGASQLRVLGRLGFFLNDEVIERAMRLKLNDLGSEVDPSRLAEDKRVVIVSSIAGGTGAGMLIDMAYVARRQLLRPRVFAYLLLPEVFQDVDSGGRIFQNSYACLKELAYLKDQQIPFDADYERIPPIHIPVAGEEPFSRIFLCRGDGFAGSESIKDATVQIASSIFAQMQRTIQEKTLAIASNTLSADPSEEQRKRRTHCFSTVTSTILELEKLDIPDVVFQKIVGALKDDRELEGIYEENLKAWFEQVSQDLMLGSEVLEEPEEGDDEKEADRTGALPEVKRLLREWEALILDQARSTRDVLVPALQGALRGVEDEARKGSDETDLDQLRSTVDEVRKLTPTALRTASPPDLKLEVPAAKKALEGFDKQVLSLLQPLLPEATPTSEQALKRKAYYSQVLRWKDRFLQSQSTLGDPSKSTTDRDQAWQDRAKELAGGGRGWFRGGRTAYTDKVQRLLLDGRALQEVFSEREGDAPGEAQKDLATFLVCRAKGLLFKEIELYREKATKSLEAGLRPWIERKHHPIDVQKAKHLGELQDKIRGWMQKSLPGILDQTRALVAQDEPPETRRKKLEEILSRHLRSAPELKVPHYYLDKQPEEVEDYVRAELVRSRQQIFERRTPNPQRKGIALIMVPQGLIWPSGTQRTLRRFLEASASQILASRIQIEDYDGSRIWIYYEDLFNPPEHIRNIDEYFRTYSSQQFKELFHIDRRFLLNPVFKEIHSQRATATAFCGNPGCRENITGLPRTERICPGCGKMIRTRCGNEGCIENALDRHDKGKDKNCPVCNGFNYSAWWCCHQHGKTPYEVPIDKERCPRCIELHQEDPIAYPLSKVSVRPDVKEKQPCPNCVRLAEKDPKHNVFRIPRKLRRFYRDGVNGHDREAFFQLAAEHHLPQNVRCPSCRTILIPVHHQKLKKETPDCGGRPVE